MAVHLQKEENKLKKQILALGATVEESVRKAVASLEKRDEKLASDVLDHDNDIDQMEVDLEEECLKILALYQPVAQDLRFVIAVLKINNDLERIGDLAGNIAERALRLSQDGTASIPFDFHKMAERVQLMLRHALDALVNADVALALEVRNSDDEIDDMHREVYRIVEEEIRKDVDKVGSLIQFLAISRSLERIADHATNIAEDVTYMIEGDIVRHRMFDDD
jgi:phosphate transport system protein